MKAQIGLGLFIVIGLSAWLAVETPKELVAQSSLPDAEIAVSAVTAKPNAASEVQKVERKHPSDKEDPLFRVQSRIETLQKQLDQDRVLRPLREERLSDAEIQQVAAWAKELTKLQAQEIRLRLLRLEAGLERNTL